MYGNEHEKQEDFADFCKDDISKDTHHNPYNQVAASVSYNKNSYDLVDQYQISSSIHVPDWYVSEIISNADLSVISANFN